MNKIKREYQRFTKKRGARQREKNYAQVNTLSAEVVQQIHVYYVDLITQYIQATSAEVTSLHRQVDTLQTEVESLKRLFLPVARP